MERSFQTAQDRLVKGLRVAKARTLEQANRYLEEEFLPWWNQHLVVLPANPTDAHRPLGAEHNLAASLSQVITRQVDNDYTIRLEGKTYRVEGEAMPAGLRGAAVRIEQRLDGSLMLRFRERYFPLSECPVAAKAAPVAPAPKHTRPRPPAQPSQAMRASMDGLLRKKGPPVWKAARTDRTRTVDRLEE